MTDTGASRTPTIGALGMALVVIGAALVLISFTVLDWYPGSTGPGEVAHIKFADLHRLAADNASIEFAGAYFHWLAWVLLILVITVGLGATVATRAASALRVAGFTAGAGGAAITYEALDILASTEGGSALDGAQAGVWLAIGGYLVAGIGAALGPALLR
jgi:hypothetical protein